VRLRGIDNGTGWLQQPNLTAGWAIVAARGNPTPGEVMYGSNANTVVYPTVDEGVVHVVVRTPGMNTHPLSGDIFCREAPGVAFDGHAVLDQEVVLPP
jgi:hypothetical protein